MGSSNEFGKKENLEGLISVPRDQFDIIMNLRGAEVILIRNSEGVDAGKVIQGAMKKDMKGRLYVENFEDDGAAFYLVANYFQNGDKVAIRGHIFNPDEDLDSLKFSVVSGFPNDPQYTGKYFLRPSSRLTFIHPMFFDDL